MATYNLFISHAWRYSDQYNTVVQWLDVAQEFGLFDWKNYSVPEHDPLLDPNSNFGKRKLQGEIDQQLRPASIVIIIAGMYAAHSDWIQFEILKAVNMGKYIIGLKPWGNIRMPNIVQENANMIVSWNSRSLYEAILSR